MAAGSLVATGVVLAATFFPMLFNQWLSRDDEGVFVFALREFLGNHGHLYSTVWSDMYGPFYYLFMSTIYRVIGQQPTLENGRWIVLTLTTASAGLFGASVWRVTKNLPCSLICETATFLILIQVAGNESMHPGSLGVFLVAVVAFELSSYAATRRTAHLVAIGAATGALMMTKVNSGGLVAAAVVFALVVGGQKSPRWLQLVVAGLTVLLPIALVSQNITKTWAEFFAIVIVGSIVGMFVLMSIDQLPEPRLPLLPLAEGAAAAIICSLVFPLLSGTHLSDEIAGVFIRPLTLPHSFTVPASVQLEWFTVVLTIAGIAAAVVFRSRATEMDRALVGWTNAALAALSLWLLGLGTTVFANGWVVAKWLPVIVVLPALAVCAGTSASIRLALRAAVVLAILQLLVVYPVAGSQVAWGTVAMVVPCAIALAVGVDHSRAWRESGMFIRGGATLFLCVALIVVITTNNVADVWPPSVWKTYVENPKLAEPGAGLIHVYSNIAVTVQAVVNQLRANCDTFYDVPDQNSFYIFSGLPAVTGMVANGGPTALTAKQQLQVVDALQEKSATYRRVCIMRDSSQPVVVPGAPLTDALNQYSNVVATIGTYTISRHS